LAVNDVRLLGLDLAWAPANPSGLAVLDGGGRLLDVRADVFSDADVRAWIDRWIGTRGVIAFDMPTIVNNASGSRAAERELAAVFARHRAGPYPANRGIAPFRDGGGRAMRLIAWLKERYGVREDTDVRANDPRNVAIEVFPHPAHIRLFGRSTIFRYKKKAGRSWASVWSEWAAYRAALASLATADPPLSLGTFDLPLRVAARGRAYKVWDDTLDAITCAYVAAYVHRWGTGPRVEIFGTLEDGYILVPNPPSVSPPSKQGTTMAVTTATKPKNSKPFFTDVQALRDRARKNLENGAVTDTYEGDVNLAIELLQGALATEIVCVLRYTMHAVAATGIASEGPKDEFLQHAKEEQGHMMQLAERINQLGGTPNFNPEGLASRSASEYGKTEADLVEMLKENLIAERIAIDHYRELVNYFGMKDSTTRVMLEGILAVEEEHANDMHDLLVAHEGKPFIKK
jgi:bacterioferritin